MVLKISVTKAKNESDKVVLKITPLNENWVTTYLGLLCYVLVLTMFLVPENPQSLANLIALD